MEQDSQHYETEDEAIDLFELWATLWADKFLILGITALFAFGSVIYALSLPEIFRSEALLASAEARQPSNPLLSQLGAAAGFAGISVGGESSSRINTAIATLQSREFIRQFIMSHDLAPMLLASKWDESASRNIVDENIYDMETGSWKGPVPSDFEAYQSFRNMLSVSENQSTRMVTIALEWTDPVLIKQWVDWLVQDINAVFKQQDVMEATNAIEYLQSQLETTQLVEMQRVFYQLIESQTRTIMLADVREEYVFRVLDPAFIPEQKIRPRRSTICIVGSLLGAIFAILSLFLRNAIQNRKQYLHASQASTQHN